MVTSEKLHWRLHKHLKGLAKNRLRVRLSPLKSPRTFKDQSNRQFVILCISLLSLLQQYRNVLPTTIKKCLPKENVCVCVCLSVCHITFLSGYICSDTLRIFWHVVTLLASTMFWHLATSLTSTMFWYLLTSLKSTTLIVAWRRARRCSFLGVACSSCILPAFAKDSSVSTT